MKGKPVFGVIDATLEVARVHVVVMLRDYAEFKYYLSELDMMLKSKKRVIPVCFSCGALGVVAGVEGPICNGI